MMCITPFSRTYLYSFIVYLFSYTGDKKLILENILKEAYGTISNL